MNLNELRLTLTAVLLLAALSIANPSAAIVTVRNIPPTPHRAPVGTPLADIAASIRNAAAEQHWSVTEEGRGLFTANLWVRQKHRAIVRIGFDESNYWIEYLDSVNLGYNERDGRPPGQNAEVVKGPRIHANYNR